MTADAIARNANNFDPFSTEFRINPEAFHQALIASSPGAITMGGVPSVFVASHAQATKVLREHHNFSSVKPKGLPGMERVDFFNGLPVMNYSDPPDHTRRRKVVNAVFLPKRIEELTDAGARIIDAAFERAIDRQGPWDAIDELTKRLAMEILLDHFLGVAKEDQDIFLTYLRTLPLLDSLTPGEPKPRQFLDAWEAGAAYCRRQLQLARDGKCRSLIGVIASSVDNAIIDEDEMMAMMIVLLIGGVGAVSATAGSALLYLARDRQIAERIRADPALAAKHHEEALRVDPPVPLVLRFGTPGSEIAGTPIDRDMPIYVMLSSASRDPAVFPDPDQFSLDRSNSHMHLAFGYGIHTCIGNSITRNIVPLLVRKAVNRFSELAVVDEPEAISYDTSNPRGRHLVRLMLEVA